MSAALYNRYRPATFAQIVGQAHVTDALRRALSTGRLHHAYLFSGPRGCGKTSSARILAASLNCVHGPTPEPCGVCDECVGIRTGSSMDVTEIDAASHGLVDDARDLRERAFFAPASARFKVFVVDEAHMVTAAAFNALLKVVEEPPPYLKFVFATTEPDKVLPTIRSRTHHYAFRLVPPAVLREHLASICQQEGVPVDPTVLPLIVRAGAGSVRDSLSVLDQLLAGADDDGLHYERAVTLLGMTDGVLLDETVDALARRDGAALFTVVDKVVSAGHDPRRFALDLLDRFRDLIVMAAVPDATDRGLLESFSPDQVDRMRAQATSVGPAELSRTADVLHAGLIEMRGTTSPRLMLELILARALLPTAATDPAALLTRLERLERLPAFDGHLPSHDAPPAGPPPTATNAHAQPPAHAATAPPPDPRRPTPAGPQGPAWQQQPGPAGQHVPEGMSEGAGVPGGHGIPGGPGVVGAPAMAGPVRPGPAVQGPGGWAPVASPTGGYGSAAATGTTGGYAGAGGVGVGAGGGGAGGGGRIDAAGLRTRWDAVLGRAAQRSRKTHAILKDHASVADVRGDEVILAFASQPMGRMFGQGNNAEVFCAALAEEVGGSWRVSVAPAGGSPAGRGGGRPGGPPPAPPGGGYGGGAGGYGGAGPGTVTSWGGSPAPSGASGSPAVGFGGAPPSPPVAMGGGHPDSAAPSGAGHVNGSSQPAGPAHPPGSGYPPGPGQPAAGEWQGAAASQDFGRPPSAGAPTSPPAWGGRDEGGAVQGAAAPNGAAPNGSGGSSGAWGVAATGEAGGFGLGQAAAVNAAAIDPANAGAVQGRTSTIVHTGGGQDDPPPAPRPGGPGGSGPDGTGGPDGTVPRAAAPAWGNTNGAAVAGNGNTFAAGRPGEASGPATMGGGGGAFDAGQRPPIMDEPPFDDEDIPQQAGGARGGEEAAMSLLRTGLGATVLEQTPTS
ncbi:DNA polymerase III subunit gamma and tau [Candidatus Frankia nodulisporulans]|uniref:DNA polymerase III subunit gamma and tau n=2 Tax=Candidatus Frankia nodulisporulans TaxID=2060052 RepID=UPI0015843D27|nr:DNA polymerase III subunit gamma and tau [Candidatus Frankia nodulisporulans]